MEGVAKKAKFLVAIICVLDYCGLKNIPKEDYNCFSITKAQVLSKSFHHSLCKQLKTLDKNGNKSNTVTSLRLTLHRKERAP